MNDSVLHSTIARIEESRIDAYADSVLDWTSVETSTEDTPVCMDSETCKCPICREINAGIRDGKRADELTRIHLGNTARDIMPNGKHRFADDLYWQGILTGIES